MEMIKKKQKEIILIYIFLIMPLKIKQMIKQLYWKYMEGGGRWNKRWCYSGLKTFGSQGFMYAVMSYTLLNGNYKEYNIFRIIDEIIAVIKILKKLLVQLGYNENKLELFLIGGSAGSHLCMLYSYMIKNPPIPTKFILNAVGPVILILNIF